MGNHDIFRQIIEGLMCRGKFTLSWDSKDNCYPVNVNSYKDAKLIAQTCELAGFYAYCETRYGEPYAVHITDSPVYKKTYLPI